MKEDNGLYFLTSDKKIFDYEKDTFIQLTNVEGWNDEKDALYNEACAISASKIVLSNSLSKAIILEVKDNNWKSFSYDLDRFEDIIDGCYYNNRSYIITQKYDPKDFESAWNKGAEFNISNLYKFQLYELRNDGVHLAIAQDSFFGDPSLKNNQLYFRCDDNGYILVFSDGELKKVESPHDEFVRFHEFQTKIFVESFYGFYRLTSNGVRPVNPEGWTSEQVVHAVYSRNDTELFISENGVVSKFTANNWTEIMRI